MTNPRRKSSTSSAQQSQNAQRSQNTLGSQIAPSQSQSQSQAPTASDTVGANNVVRSIAACQRCRIKKVKCDQNFPKCAKCERAGLECVGIDPATGREVPRSYVYHLEEEVKRQASRIEYLERQLKEREEEERNEPKRVKLENDGQVAEETTQTPAGIESDDKNLEDTSSSTSGSNEALENENDPRGLRSKVRTREGLESGCENESQGSQNQHHPGQGHQEQSRWKRKRASDALSSASPPVVPFAKLIETANKVSVSASGPMASVPGASVAALEVAPAILPPRQTAMEFIRIFFAQSNSQLPVLHRETFLRDIFAPIYGPWEGPLVGQPRRMVWPQRRQSEQKSQIGQRNSNFTPEPSLDFPSENILQSPEQESEPWLAQYKRLMSASLAPGADPAAVSQSITTPHRFRKPLFFLNIIFAISSSTNHLQYHTHISESFKEAAMRYVDGLYASADSLEQLEAVLLQTLYSVMRPNVPGVWYLLGTALRLCVDLGLHKEEAPRGSTTSAFVKDRRRRLFWSAYSIDRQMCFYLGRPVGIPEESITARFPSALDDSFMSPDDTKTKDYSEPTQGFTGPSIKYVTLAFLRVRQIQSECQRLLYENGELPRRFESLGQWKAYISEELERWRAQCPRDPRMMNCDFNVEFFDLNYFHTLLLINGLSKKTSRLTSEGYFKVLDASRGLMACYSVLYRKKAINYTWAAVHNLFMAGTSYLFVLYNSEHVRSIHPADAVKAITEDCLSVFASLVASCTAAKACMDTFQMLTAVVLKIRYKVTVEGAMVANISTNGMKQNLFMVSGTGSLKGNLASLVEGINSENANNTSSTDVSNVASPANFDSPRFGWVSRDFEQEGQQERSYDSGPPTQGVPDIHLEDFFLELENLSPGSSIRESTAMDMALTQSENLSATNSAQGDGRRVFELIQQMPFEPIWDQFFAGQNVPRQDD